MFSILWKTEKRDTKTCAKDSKSVGEIIESLITIREILDLEDMVNRLDFL